MADTDIELGVSLNPKDVKSRAQNIQREVQSAFDKINTGKVDQKTKRTLTRMSELATKSQQLQNTLKGMEDAFPAQLVEGFETACEEAQRLNDIVDNSTTLSDEAKDGIRAQAQEWQNLANTYSTYINRLQQGETAGSILHETSEQYQRTEQQLNHVSNTIATIIPNTNNASASMSKLVQQTNLLGATGNIIEGIGSRVQRLSRDLLRTAAGFEETGQVGKASLSGLGAVAVGITGRIIKTLGQIIQMVGKVWSVVKPILQKAITMTGQLIKRVGTDLVKAVRSLGNAFKLHLSGGNKQLQHMGMTAKKVLGALLGFATLRAMFSKITGAIREGVNNLAKWNNGNNSVNQSLSMLTSSLTQFKNSLGAAFAPILGYVAPILNTLISLCTRAANAIAMLLAALGGSKTFIKAKKVQQDYATSLGNTAKAAGAAQDKLAKFDDLDVLGVDKSGGGGGGGAGGGFDPSMFEMAPVESWANDWIDKLKDMWANADFTELGRILGEKLRDALNQASDWLVSTAQPIARKLGKSLATFLIGFFETEGLGQAIGRFFGELLNTWIYFEQAFLDTLEPHARNLGRFIGDIIMTALQTIDFATMGHNLAQKLNIFFDVLQGIADQWDPQVVATAITDFINTAIADIHWAANGKALSDFAIDLLQSIRLTLEQLDWAGLGKGIADFLNNIDWVGVANELAGSINALVDGIWTLLKTIINETNWGAVFEGLKTFLEEVDLGPIAIVLGAVLIKNIAQVVFSELAKQGLSKAISGILDSIASGGTLATFALTIGGIVSVIGGGLLAIGSFFDMLFDGFSWLKEILMTIGLAIAAVGAVILGAPAAVAAVVAAIVGTILTAIVVIKDNWTEICEFFKGVWQGICDGASAAVDFIKGVWDSICQFFSDIIQNIKDLFGIASPSKVMMQIGVDIVQGLFDGISSLIDKIKKIWEDLKTNALNVWNYIKTTLIQIVTSLKEKVIELWNELKNKLHDILTVIKNTMQNIWNSIKNAVINLVTALKNTVISLFNALKNTITNIMNAVKTFLINTWTNIKNTVVTIVTNLKNTVLNVFDALKSGVRNAINGIIGFVEGMANAIANGINKVVDGIKEATTFEWTNPFTGTVHRSNGISLPKMPTVSLPRLAQGAVIPPNRQFMAMLGDQRQGTNIEAPLETIKEALRDVMANMEVHNTGYSEMKVDGQTFARLMTPYIVSELRREGYNVSILGG